MTTPLVIDVDVVRVTGRVKWFNNKAGYGFISVTDGAQSGSDIFVHHSSLEVSNEQYKYLVQGEYVEFVIVSTPNNSSSHEFQASSVSGIKMGKLMCETIHESKQSRTAHQETSTSSRTIIPRSNIKIPESPRDPPPPPTPLARSSSVAGAGEGWSLQKKRGRKPSAPKAA